MNKNWKIFTSRNSRIKHKYGNIFPVPEGKLRQGAQFKLDWEQPAVPGMGHPHFHSQEFLPHVQPKGQVFISNYCKNQATKKCRKLRGNIAGLWEDQFYFHFFKASLVFT